MYAMWHSIKLLICVEKTKSKKKKKSLNQVRTETLRVNIAFNGETLEAFPIKSGRIL